MKKFTSLTFVVITSFLGVNGQNTYTNLLCQTSGGSPSATDLYNMGAALRVAPQATKNYCGGPSTWGGYVFYQIVLSPKPLFSFFKKRLKEHIHFYCQSKILRVYLLTTNFLFSEVCSTAATWNTAAVNICTGEESQFCIQGSELGITVQEMAITCRNGANLAGGVIQANGNDGNIAEVAIFHS
jgi:hypothetical protein